MSVLTAQNIVDRAETILQDTTNVRWASTELLQWLNDGQREVVLLKPDANPVNESVQMTAGTKQTIPATGVQLIDVVRNMGDNGTTVGDVITFLKRNVLDSGNRDWHAESQDSAHDHFCFDERDPKHFYVYPPSDGANYVEIVYSAAPADIAIDATITLDDVYANALLDYILYRAYSKDAEFAANAQRAAMAYAAFLRSLGMREEAEKIYDPAKQPVNVASNTTQG